MIYCERQTTLKKTICLITNWYPTKDNPYQGLFFKEQAFALSDLFDFLVIHYREKIGKPFLKKYSIKKINQEKNTTEYDVVVNVSPILYVLDIYNTVKVFLRKKNIAGVGIYVSKRKKTYTKKMITRIFYDHFAEKFDLLYCVDAQKEAYYLQCVSEELGKPYIVGEHAPVPWPGTVLTDINKYAIEKANVFLAISNDKIKQFMLQNIKLPKTVYVGNLVDERKFVRKELYRDKVKTLLIVAAHSHYKNYDMFINVMNKLSDITNQKFKIMVVGYGANKGYSKGVKEFEDKIRDTKFADMLELIPEVPHDRIVDIYNKADAFVMTSIQEGQPVSAMEAACCGLPIFSTRCGGVEDYVDKEMGRIYELTDFQGMAWGLKDFLEGKIIFNSMIIREKIVNKFGITAFTKKFSETVNELL